MRTFDLIICTLVLLIAACKQKNNQNQQPTTLFTKNQTIKISEGEMFTCKKIPSTKVTERQVDVWLPNGYDKNKQYAVLYMHDGQMLFDSTTTWNQQEWKVEETMQLLINHNKIKPSIVVGIHNIPQIRHSDYFPQKVFESLPRAIKDTLSFQEKPMNPQLLNADNYLKFITQELKPIIDKEFSTMQDASNTHIAGSSMGGLISMYALCEYPNVFGSAACLSTHWPGVTPTNNNPVPAYFFSYMQQNLPSPKTHKIYFDYGNKTLDEHYVQYAKQVDAVLKEKKYTKQNAQNLFFEGEDHTENAWSKRLHIPLTFILNQTE